MKGAWETMQDEKGTQAWADIGETYPAAGFWPNHLLCFGQSAAVFSLLLIVSVALSGGQKCLMVITRKKAERLFVVAVLPEILSWSAVPEIICVRSTISSCRFNSVNPLNRKEASGVNNFQGTDRVKSRLQRHTLRLFWKCCCLWTSLTGCCFAISRAA